MIPTPASMGLRGVARGDPHFVSKVSLLWLNSLKQMLVAGLSTRFPRHVEAFFGGRLSFPGQNGHESSSS